MYSNIYYIHDEFIFNYPYFYIGITFLWYDVFCTFNWLLFSNYCESFAQSALRCENIIPLYDVVILLQYLA